MEHWYQILACGGVMFGDDYNVPSVRAAVDSWGKQHGIHIEALKNGEKWSLPAKKQC